MTEMIDPIDHTIPARFLINTMAAESKRSDLLEHFNIELVKGEHVKVEVELKINGVEVDFSRAITEMWDRLRGSYDRDVLEKAKEYVSQTRFEKLNELLQDAEYKIQQELEVLIGRADQGAQNGN